MQYSPYQYVPPAQARLSQMEQQFPQFAQNYPQYPSYSQSGLLKGRPVSSYDEAKASMIDLDGSVSIFPDFGNGKIYTKQINLDGTATINTYSIDGGLKPTPNNAESSKSESNALDLINNLQSQIDALKDEISRLGKERGEKYAESTRANDVTESKNRSHDEEGFRNVSRKDR